MKDILISLRTENRYSQNALAKELGISRQAYIKYETGEVEPSVEIIRKLSKIFNVSYAYLIDNGKCKTGHSDNLYEFSEEKSSSVADASPLYKSQSLNYENVLYGIQSMLKTFSQEQLQSVYSIVQSVNNLNSSSQKPVLKRTPGGISGDLWISEDFDAPIDEFKEYM